MKNKIAGFIVALFTILAFNSAKAQCPLIDNQLGCAIQVKITLFYTCYTVPCNTMPVTLNIAAGQQLPAQCNQCNGNPYCDIQVTLTRVGGVPVSPIVAMFTTGSPGPSTSTPITCGSTANIYYNGTDFIVN